jgi:hypothetical protein
MKSRAILFSFFICTAALSHADGPRALQAANIPAWKQ